MGRKPDLRSRMTDSIRRPRKQSSVWCLLPRREVALLGARLVAAVVAIEINTSERAVVFEVGRRIGEGVLAAQFFLNFLEAVRHLFHRGREEDATAGGLGHLLQYLVAFAAAGRPGIA